MCHLRIRITLVFLQQLRQIYKHNILKSEFSNQLCSNLNPANCVSAKRRLGVGVGVGVSFFPIFFFFEIYLQIDSFWSKKNLLVYNGKFLLQSNRMFFSG